MSALYDSMVVPQPFEIAESVLLRLGRANGLAAADVLELNVRSSKLTAGLMHRSAKVAAVLSEMLSLRFDAVISRHTWLPLALALHFGEAHCGDKFDFARGGSLCVQAKRLGFCSCCRDEDRELHGFCTIE